MYLLGYIPKDDRLYLGDKELNVISYGLLLSVLEYQTAVMRRDFSTADKVLPTIPKEQRTRVANFLEKQVSYKVYPVYLFIVSWTVPMDQLSHKNSKWGSFSQHG